MSRRQLTNFLAVLAVIGIALLWQDSHAAQAQNIQLTFATTTPPKSNLEIASERFVKIIQEKSGGRIQIKHYGAGSLYNAKTIMPAIAKHQIDIGVLHVALVGRRSPVLEFIGSFGAQGCWESYAHYFRFLDTPRTRQLASAEFTKYFNSQLLAALAFGTSLVGRRDKPIGKVADYRGLKMRTSGTAQATMYKALGAIPVGLSSKEIYTALQRGTIQGATSGVSRWRRSKLYEVAPYLTIDPTLPYLSMWLVINNSTWNKLSAADRKLFTQTAKQIEAWTRKNAAEERTADLAFLKSKAKALVELPPAQKKKLISIVVPVMKNFAKAQLGSHYQELWGLLEKTK